jgi:SAM-dependent methyltransferase
MRCDNVSVADNPWLLIPAADYEGHMSAPHIAQAQFLSQVFKEALRVYDASTVAQLGCATGNGLEHIDPAATRRLSCVDINPEYLAILRARYGERIAGLEVVEADLATCRLQPGAYSLIFTGLVFEYVAPKILLPKIADWLRPDGVLVVVLQILAQGLPEVSESPYQSLKLLESIMRLVSPQEFRSTAENESLGEIESKIVTLESGKAFYVGTFTRA